MKSISEEFVVEVGRVRSLEEVRSKRNEFQPFVARERGVFNAACSMQRGPAREAALEQYHADFPERGVHSIALEALDEVIPDLEQLGPGAIEDHIRNARHWIGMFGSDAYIRLNVFYWISGVKPNYDPLDDPTEEEEIIFDHQAEEMARPLREMLELESIERQKGRK